MKLSRIFISCLLALMVTGCATKTHYYWGNYEAIIYKQYVEPGSADPAAQIQLLSEDLEQAESYGKPVPPGVHAHLGYMYYLNGDYEKAQFSFNQEMSLFPESENFIQGLISRAKGQ
ncbi:DUF4810 domain-containing protein [Bacterioplanoides sp.]|uniref:DUF4810 domain-containing protein n=1 Tax=Bacterioplanoides sp. TaxID=2066072 RepID=UPI003B5B93FC